MFILRCTKPLLARVKKTYPSADPHSRSATVLGDWYAAPYRFRKRSMVIAVAEHSRLCVVCEPASLADLVADLQARLAVLLRDIGVPVQAINPELRRMATVQVGPTRNRSVVGSLVDHRYSVECWFDVEERPFTLEDMNRELSTTPSALLQWNTHGEAADRLLWDAIIPEP